LVGGTSSFGINSFPSSRAVRGVVIPRGEAGISVYVPAEIAAARTQPPRTVDEWMKIVTARQTIESAESQILEIENRKLSASEVRVRCCGKVEPWLETTEWFFQVDGQFFGASLSYWSADGEARKRTFQAIFREVIESLRVLA
jgi:hypothetical protein